MAELRLEIDSADVPIAGITTLSCLLRLEDCNGIIEVSIVPVHTMRRRIVFWELYDFEYAAGLHVEFVDQCFSGERGPMPSFSISIPCDRPY